MSEKTLKERFLITQNAVELRNGNVYLIVNNFLIKDNDYLSTLDFDGNLKCKGYKSLDIVKVYEVNVFSYGFDFMKDKRSINLIWERKNEIILTPDELVILKNIDKRFKFITRNNKEEVIQVWINKPKEKNGFYTNYDTEWTVLSSFSDIFDSIKFESGIVSIEELIKENER